MRTCDTCGVEMAEGYCCGDGEEYYCSDDCLFVDGYTPEQKEIDYDNGNIYWTSWEEEEHESMLYDLEENIQFPVLLTAHNSDWRGQTGTATADTPEEALQKVYSFDGTVELKKKEDELYFMVWTHDVPTGFRITIKELE